MTMTISGDSGLTYPNSSTQANALVGFKNRVIDGGFIINQRGYTSGTALSAGSYGHDRWKGGASGGTYTFTQGSTGVNTTITITANSLQQVIEGCNMPEGGTYTLSWTGTAQGKIAGGSYSSSPVTATGLTAGANCTIEFNTGTCGSVQVEAGSTATSFDYRSYGTELQLCQRYYEKSYDIGTAPTTNTTTGTYNFSGSSEGNGNVIVPIQYFTKRTAPTLTGYLSAGTSGSWNYEKNGGSGTGSITFDRTSDRESRAYIVLGTNWVVGYVYGHWTASAEL